MKKFASCETSGVCVNNYKLAYRPSADAMTKSTETDSKQPWHRLLAMPLVYPTPVPCKNL